MMSQGFYVDIRPIIHAYDPTCSRHSAYFKTPMLKRVVSEVTLCKIIECIFAISPKELQDEGAPSLLYEYIENTCEVTTEVLCSDPDFLDIFNCFVNEITEAMDQHLRLMLAQFTCEYDSYVFDHWVTGSLAVFLRLEHEP